MSFDNDIIITAMDRFVWFVLLVVMSHLVTEFTRVTGYARGNRHDVILINDSLVQPMPVANMIFYPGQEYGLYDQASSSNTNNNNNNYYHNGNANANANINANNNNAAQSSGALAGAGATNAQTLTGFNFSFRPIIDSIFEIPISTLRAVNNLVARLTGSYQHQAIPVNGAAVVLKAATANAAALPAFRALDAGAPNAPLLMDVQSSRATAQTDSSSNDVNSSSSSSNGNTASSAKVFVVRSSALREVNA